MNNSIIALNPIINSNSGSTNGEIKYINGNSMNMPINNTNSAIIDQSQMLQIQQFLNDLQQQQTTQQTNQPHQQQQNILAAAESLSLNELNQQQSLQNLLDIVVTSPTSSQQQQQQSQQYYQQPQANNANQQNSIILSPNSIIKIDPQYVHTQQHQQQQQQQIFIQNQPQIENQVHTIMLNGQPALFIPASSAMSSNLLCQMLMNNNTAPNQVYSTDQLGLPIQLQLPQQTTSTNHTNTVNNDYQSLLSNNQIIINQPNDITNNTIDTEANNITHQQPHQQQQQQQQQVINLAQVLSSNSNDANSLQFLQMSNTNNELDTHNNQVVCKIEQDLIQPIQQQQAQIQQQQQQHFVLHSANNTAQLTTDQSQLGQQIICIQPDGNITFQTLPFVITQPQTVQQPIQQQENLNIPVTITNSSTPNTTTTVTTTTKKTKTSKPKITPTIATVLSSPDKLKAKLLQDDLVNKSNGKKSVNNKVAIILNSNENKLKQQQSQQLEEQSIRIDMQSPQQWVFMNGVDSQVVINSSQNANNDSSSSSSKNENENTTTFDNILNSSQNGGVKRKRKACDCPNCLKYRENTMTPEELAKKRTHKCHKCTKEYNKTSHLRAHLRAHDNYRPYVCDFKTCGKSFTRSDELKRHKRIHNDDRNFPCTICKKKFLRSDHLNKHLLVHNKPTNSDGNQENKQNKPKKSSQTIKKIKLESVDVTITAASITNVVSSASSASSSTSTE